MLSLFHPNFIAIMKASELYNKTTTEVDQLQKALHNHVRDQLSLSQDLATHQDRMKRLADIIINEGDRELTGQEVIKLQLSKDFISSVDALTESLNNNWPTKQNNVIR